MAVKCNGKMFYNIGPRKGSDHFKEAMKQHILEFVTSFEKSDKCTEKSRVAQW
jgi:hypothetical protein